MNDLIVITMLSVFLVAAAVCFLWGYIKIYECYGVPNVLVDLKNWLVKKFRG